MKLKITVALLLACVVACQGAARPPKHATLHVTTANLRETTASLSYDGQETIITDTFKVPVEAGQTEPQTITVELDRPGYYSLFRNPLYLSPGDELTIDLRDSNTETVIGGTQGVEANNYLKQRYYSKGGSFLDAGSVLCDETPDMVAEIRKLGAERQRQLDALTGVSDEFRELERIRIKADMANSMFAYPSYNGEKMFPEDLTRETFPKFLNEYHEGIKDFMLPLLREVAADDRYLDIEVARAVLSQARDIEAYKEVELSERFLALEEIYGKARRISGNMDKTQYDELRAYGERIPYADLRAVYMQKLDANSRLMEGMPAVDVALRDVDGKTMKLSELAGKAMYVDVWATWCGPCIAESPYFEALSREYPGIAFVALSVDGNTKAWENSVRRKDHGAITEVLATEDMRKGWDITGIPRFLLIDADFNIISADAPRPSQGDEIRPLLEKYSQK